MLSLYRCELEFDSDDLYCEVTAYAVAETSRDAINAVDWDDECSNSGLMGHEYEFLTPHTIAFKVTKQDERLIRVILDYVNGDEGWGPDTLVWGAKGVLTLREAIGKYVMGEGGRA